MKKPEQSQKTSESNNSDREKTSANQSDTEISGQNIDPELTIDELDKLLEKRKLKRVYRTDKSALTDPKQGPKQEVNRLTQKVSTRVSAEHVKLFNACAEKFPSKRSALEKAIEDFAHSNGIDPYDFLPE